MKKLLLLLVFSLLIIPAASALQFIDDFEDNINSSLWTVNGLNTYANQSGQGLGRFVKSGEPGATNGYARADGVLSPIDFNGDDTQVTINFVSAEFSGGNEIGTVNFGITDGTTSLYFETISSNYNIGEDLGNAYNITFKVDATNDELNYTVNSTTVQQLDISSLSNGAQWSFEIYLTEDNANVETHLGYISYGDDPAFNINLLTPTNNSNYTKSLYNASITNTIGYELTNATLYVYNSSGTLILNNYTTVTTGDASVAFEDIVINDSGSYLWNVEVCTNNGTCNFSASNNSYDLTTYSFDSIDYRASVEEAENSVISTIVSVINTKSISSANLIYNNTATALGLTQLSSNVYELNQTVTAPSVSGLTAIDFYYELTFNDGLMVNSTTYQQNVSDFQGFEVLASCSAGLHPAINFTFADEQNLSNMTNDVEYNAQIGFPAVLSTDFGSFNDVSGFSICINETRSQTLTGEIQINYGETPWTDRTFYLFTNQTLSNESTTEHILYDLLTADAQSFLVTVQDNALSPYQDRYVSLMRWYPDLNEYKVVEMGRTDESGQSVLKVVVEDVDYRFGVYDKDGTLLKMTDPLRIVCLIDPCEITISVDEDVDFTSFSEIASNLSYNDATQVFTYIWNDPNQKTSLIELNIYELTSIGERLICTTSSTSFTGVLTCDVSGETGQLKAIVERSASPPIIISTLHVDLSPNLIDSGGGEMGLFLSFILIIFVALASLINPVVGVIGAVVALIPALIFGSITVTILIPVITMMFIVIHFMKRT